MNFINHKQAIFLNPCQNFTNSSDSSSILYDKRPGANRSFPKSPKNPEKVLESMVKHFKIHKAIPTYLVSELPLDTCKAIVESLICEKLMLQDELSVKADDMPSDQEKENAAYSNQISPPLIKMQAFRALENVSPIEKDDSVGHTNYNIVSLALTPHEEIVVNTIVSKSNKYEDYKREVLKLANELKEVFSYNQILCSILALEKNTEFIQLNEHIKKKVGAYNALVSAISEELKSLKKTIEPNEGFLENIALLRSEIKILSEMIEFTNKCDLKPSEMQTVNHLIELSIEDPKKLDSFIDSLLAGHDIAEISYMLVKYIKFLEEQSGVSLKSEALNCLITELRNELMIEESINDGLKLDKEIEEINRELERMKFEKSRSERAEQVKIRENPVAKEKQKWKLPEEMQGLSGIELYSKTLKRLKKK